MVAPASIDFWSDLSVVGVIVFRGLTAWDAQRLKHMAAGPQAVSGSYAIMGRLPLSQLHQPVSHVAPLPRRSPDLIPAQTPSLITV